MKILLIGSKGNLGTCLINNSFDEIISFDREDWDKLPGILSAGVDLVIHLAYDLINRVEDLPVEVMNSNLIATTLLLEAIRKYKVPRLVFISSCAVYGECMNTIEETSCNPVTINGIVKLLNERIIEKYCSKNNIRFEIYRIFNMYGRSDNFSVLSKLKKSVAENVEFMLNNYGVSQRDFIHVEDVAKIILKLIALKHTHKYINIGTGVSVSIRQLVDLVREKHPKLMIKNMFIPEAEYSRANITKLSSLLKYKFFSVLNFIEQNF